MDHNVQEESSSIAFRCTELCVSYQSVSPVQRFWGVSRAQHDKYISVQARQGIQRVHDGVSPSLHLLYSTCVTSSLRLCYEITENSILQ